MLNFPGRADDELQSTLKELADIKFALDESSIVAITDNKGVITSVNDKFCEISQYTREELIGRTHRVINSGYHSSEFFRDMWSTISAGRVWKGEICNRAKDGTYYWVDTTIVPFLDNDAKPYQYVAIRHDITSRKATEEELRNALKELTDIKFALDESSIVALTDRQGKIKYVNDTFCKISKYSEEELLGQDHRIINSHYHPKQFFRDMWKTIGQGKVWRGEVKNRAKDGTYYWVDTTIIPFLDADGKPYQYAAIRSDITERKVAEELLRKSERLALVSHLAAGVAHEIKNPLVGVKRVIRLLQTQLAEEQDVRQAEASFSLILSELDRIEFIMNEYLVLAKPQIVNYQDNDLAVMIQSILRLLDFEAAVNSIEIETDFASDIPRVQCDENQIKQVFINIIKNAIEAMPKGGKLTIQMRRQEDCVVTRFIDEGCGIPDDLLPKLGEPFSTTKEKGTGLGLMVSNQIIEAHNGKITMASKVNEGTTVEITLPIQPN